MNTNYHLTSRFLKQFTYKELCRSFITEDKEKLSYEQLSIKYRLTVAEVRTILSKCKQDEPKKLEEA